MEHTIGTCSRCGGRVTIPAIWHGVIPPVPTCQKCGATKKRPHGPVVEMDELPRSQPLSPLIRSTDQQKGAGQ